MIVLLPLVTIAAEAFGTAIAYKVISDILDD